ncbi:phytanoyl-coa dioxygenase [Rhypophila sp. PSN 637]
MEGIQDARESRRLVKTYSWEVAERLPNGSDSRSNILSQVLHDSAGEPDPKSLASPWRKFFEPADFSVVSSSPATRIVAVEAAKLREKWVLFRRSCSKDDTLDLESFDPTVESVFDLITNLNTAVQAKRKTGLSGKITSTFHKFCDKLDSHSHLLKILPEGNEYVSIFAGTLNAIISASVNHERVAEGLATALVAISENVAECQAELQLFQTEAMIEKVGDLYAHVFIFLSSYMDWMMRKRATRLLDSFNENLFRKFELDIQKINERSAAIRNLVAQSSRAELRETRLHVESLARDFRVGQEGEARHRAEMEYFAARIERELAMTRQERRQLEEEGRQVKELSAQLTRLLQERAMEWVEDERAVRTKALGGSSPLPIRLAVKRSPRPSAQMVYMTGPLSQWTSDDVSLNSAHLEDFFYRDRVRLPNADDWLSAGIATAPSELIQRLAEWTSSPARGQASSTSNILWIDGPPIEADDLHNEISLLAATVVSMADRSSVPVMSYFSELRRREVLRPGVESQEMQGFLAMIYSLLRQMIESLMPVIEVDSGEADFSVDRFATLDGTTKTWDEVVEVFKDLVPLCPSRMFVVIDGMHWVDGRDTEIYIERLVDLLRENGSKFKVLFTTSGRVPTLRKLITPEEALLVEAVDTVLGGRDHLGSGLSL